jgi:glycosyltransferase involved in cell wall biosynthesis
MQALYNKNTDIRWRSFPWLFFLLEDWLLPRMNSAFVVREDAVGAYQRRYPAVANRFAFTPTWMDPDLFYPILECQRDQLKLELSLQYRFSPTDFLLISVGRLDQSKDPLLQLDTFARLTSRIPEASLVMVGDGVLREQIAKRSAELGLEGKLIMAGLRSASEVAKLLRVADIFILSSAYEGMPMCVLEALGSGVPVATTGVGEVHRVVKPGINGAIASERSAAALAEAIVTCYKHRAQYAGEACTAAVAEYVPERVLAPLYDNYRRLAGMRRA